ncbi:accessory Sec system protein Asp2 [Eubacterium sp. TM05-53]|nr:accessory Sec system protein Asp2 [Eubacterium sp. TM05-53]
MNKISVLQVGNEDLSLQLHIPDYVEWNNINDLKDATERSYDVCVLNRCINEKEARILLKKIRAYTLFLLDDVQVDQWTTWICTSRRAKIIDLDTLQKFIDTDIHLFFMHSYGEKFAPQALSISQYFKGKVFWNGFSGVELEGEYGEDYFQIACWRYNAPIQNGETIDFWLEYEKDDSVSVQLKIEQFQTGLLSNLQNRLVFSEKDLNSLIYIENQKANGSVFVSLHAKGKGKLKIVGLHDRHSRKSYGSFLPGGIRKVTSKREEVFLYFDPGDMKPPLNVYFSGYKTKEGFEGYNIMRKMGAPFLLVAESRLEGGGFYLGDKEYEDYIVSGIQNCLNQLGFDRSQLILSGLSMGTFGALYNGCKLRPHAILLGKPLASLGDIAVNERISRPGGFPTSLDVLVKNYGDMSEKSIDALNHRFWDLFDQTDWSQTKFIVSYMLEDDYDMTAYDRLISHIDDIGVEIIGKGVHGRHNDDTYSIVAWFKNQYEGILKSDFGRGDLDEE